jgi:hypothetical protein
LRYKFRTSNNYHPRKRFAAALAASSENVSAILATVAVFSSLAFSSNSALCFVLAKMLPALPMPLPIKISTTACPKS